jgi:hypothetical protein
MPAGDSAGETIDFVLSHNRDAGARSVSEVGYVARVGGIRSRVINVDGHAAYPQAIRELKASPWTFWSTAFVPLGVR